jgi:hypothetical protein
MVYTYTVPLTPFDSSKGIFFTNQGECNSNFGHCNKGMNASPGENGGQTKASTTWQLVSPIKPLRPSNFGHCIKGVYASPVENGEQTKASKSLQVVSPIKPLRPSSNSPNLLLLMTGFTRLLQPKKWLNTRGECGELRRIEKNGNKTEKWAQPIHRLVSVFLV